MKKNVLIILLCFCLVMMLTPITGLAEEYDDEKISIINAEYSYFEDYKYTGEPLELELRVWMGDKYLYENIDYTVSYLDYEFNQIEGIPVDIGKYYFVINGMGDYEDTGSPTYINIYDPSNPFESFDLDDADIWINHFYPDTGLPVVLEINKISINNVFLKESDYMLSFEDEDGNELAGAPSDAGQYYAIFTGEDPYYGSQRIIFFIKAANDLMFADIYMIEFYPYTGQAVVLDGPIVTMGEQILSENVDYKISYLEYDSSNYKWEECDLPTDAEMYLIKIEGIGSYIGEILTPFWICELNSLLLASVEMAEFYWYTGSPIVLSEVTLRMGEYTLVEGVDYYIYFEDWYEGEEVDEPMEVGYYAIIFEAMGPDYIDYTYKMFRIIEKPIFTAQPTDQTVTVGQAATFSARAAGDFELSYQWQFNSGSGWTEITGATAANYTTPTTTTRMNGYEYRCLATDKVGSIESNSATITVNAESTPPSPPEDEDPEGDSSNGTAGDNNSGDQGNDHNSGDDASGESGNNEPGSGDTSGETGLLDVPDYTDTANHWAIEDIQYVAARGLMIGTSATTFSPESSMTRGMFATVLGRLAGVDGTNYEGSSFTDVGPGSYYAPHVAWAAEQGITNGTSATTFSPEKPINRQDIAVLLVNYAKAMGYTIPSTSEKIAFDDSANIGSYARDAVEALQMAGVIQGKGNNDYDPYGIATRAEVAAILHRFIELVIEAQVDDN